MCTVQHLQRYWKTEDDSWQAFLSTVARTKCYVDKTEVLAGGSVWVSNPLFQHQTLALLHHTRRNMPSSVINHAKLHLHVIIAIKLVTLLLGKWRSLVPMSSPFLQLNSPSLSHWCHHFSLMTGSGCSILAPSELSCNQDKIWNKLVV